MKIFHTCIILKIEEILNYKKYRKGDKNGRLKSIRITTFIHLIGAHETAYQKLNTYSNQAVDPQIKQIFTKSAQDALNTKQKLMSFLNN